MQGRAESSTAWTALGELLDDGGRSEREAERLSSLGEGNLG